MNMRKLQTVIVDDDPSIVRLLTKVLHQGLPEDLTLHSFTDPIQALDWLERNVCDILISDIEMPGTDGLVMLEKAKHRNAWTQVIFLTGHSSWDRVTYAVEHGASDFLLKPLDREQITEVVRSEIARFGRWQSALRGGRPEANPAKNRTTASERLTARS